MFADRQSVSFTDPGPPPTGVKPKRKGHSVKDAGGEVVICTPWLPEGCRKYDVCLADEITIFSQFVSMTAKEKNLRNIIVNSVKHWVYCVFPTAIIQIYGSFAYGTCTPSSALDVKCENCHGISALLPKYSASLKNQGFKIVTTMCQGPHSGFLQIEHTEERIVVNIVMTSEETSTREFTDTIQGWIKEFPGSVHVHATLRHVLSQVRCGDVKTGGLSAIALLLMVIRACRAVLPSRDNGEVLHWFLQEYGAEFAYSQHCISGSETGVKVKTSEDQLFICDPTDEANNLAATCTKIQQIKSQFLYCQMALLKWCPGQSGPKGYKGRTPLSTLISHQLLWDRVDNNKKEAAGGKDVVLAKIGGIAGPDIDQMEVPVKRDSTAPQQQRRATVSSAGGSSSNWNYLARSSLSSSLDCPASRQSHFSSDFGPIPSVSDPDWVWDIASDICNANRRELGEGA
eukprot:TRINITY_DN11209_c1_g1_i1.p1 TRINITY_DN11209_c1_g1~~TRINITY_DN11209_c1_g1_i1.p1  ORF type:complete len:470 (+),score=75.43 TRINITY_DN11209_c1_g1_i1:41-1411(+)